jgi:hypothetical protein
LVIMQIIKGLKDLGGDDSIVIFVRALFILVRYNYFVLKYKSELKDRK